MSGTNEIRCPIQQFWKDIKTGKAKKKKCKDSRVTSYCYPKMVDYYICPKGCGREDYGNMRLYSFRIIIIKDIEGEIYKIDKEGLDIQEWKVIAGLPLQLLQA